MNRDNALVLATLGAYNLKQTTHSQIQCLGGEKNNRLTTLRGFVLYSFIN